MECVLKTVETAVSANAELSFRFSMKRLELQIDQKTSATAVATMFRFLLAELTAIATIEEPKNTPNAKKVKAEGKAAAKAAEAQVAQVTTTNTPAGGGKGGGKSKGKGKKGDKTSAPAGASSTTPNTTPAGGSTGGGTSPQNPNLQDKKVCT